MAADGPPSLSPQDEATSGRPRRRWVRRALVGGLVAVGATLVLLAALHTPPARAFVLERLSGIARSRLGIELTASALDYSLLSLRVTLHGLRIDVPGDPATALTIRRLEIGLPPKALRGHLVADRVDATGVGVTIHRAHAARTAKDGTSRGALPPFEVRHLRIDDLDLMYDDPGGFGTVVVRDIALDARGMRPRHLAGRLASARGLSIATGDATVVASAVDARLTLDGSTVTVDPLRVELQTGAIEVAGTLAALAPVHDLDLRFTGHVDLSEIATWAPPVAPARGAARVTGRVAGTFGSPSVSFEADGGSTSLPFARLAAWQGAGVLDRSGLRIQRFKASTADGGLAASGVVAFGDTESDVEVSWQNVSLWRLHEWVPWAPRQLPRLSTSGAGRLTWAGAAPEIATTSGTLHADIRSAAVDGGAEGTLEATGESGRWTIRLDQRLADRAQLRTAVQTHLETGALGESPIEGSASLTARGLDTTLRDLAALGLPVPGTIPAVRTGPVTIEARLGGTVSRPAVAADLDARDVSLAGSRPLHVRGRVGIDRRFVQLDGLSATGPLGNTIHADGTLGLGDAPGEGAVSFAIAELGEFAAAVPERWRPAGNLSVSGTWSGTLDTLAATLSLSSTGLDLAGTPFSSVDGRLDVSRSRVDLRTLSLHQDAGGTLELSAGYALDTGESSLTARGRGLELAGRIAPSDITGLRASGLTIDADLAGHLDAPTGRLRVSAEDVTWREGTLGAISASAETSAGTVQLRAEAPRLAIALRASAGLTDPWPYDASLEAQSSEISRLLGLLGIAEAVGAASGTLGFSAHAAGTLARPSDTKAEATVHSIEGTLRDRPLVLAAPSRWRLSDGSVTTDGLDLSWGPMRLTVERNDMAGAEPRIRGTVQGRLEEVRQLVSPAWLEGWALAGGVQGTVEAHGPWSAPRVEGRLTVDGGSVARGDQIVASAIKGVLEAGDGVLTVRALTGSVLEGSATATGRVPAAWLPAPVARLIGTGRDVRGDAGLDLQASLPVTGLYHWLTGSRRAKVEGGVDVSVQLQAAAPDLRTLTGTLTIDRASLISGDLTLAQSEPARLLLRDGRVDVERFHLSGPRSELAAEGFVALTPDGESNLRVYGSGTMRLFDLVLPGLASGRAGGELEVRGAGASRRVTGVIDLDNVSLVLPAQRLSLADWTGRLTLNRRGIEANSIAGQINGGDVTITGFLPIVGGTTPPDPMAVKARSVLLEIPKGLRTETDADLSWRRDGDTSVLSGAVTIHSGAYREPVTQLIALVQAFSSGPSETTTEALPPWLEDLALDVRFTSAEPLRLENSVASAELVPNLRLVGTVGEPALQGQLQALEEGRLRLGGRTYRLLDSEISFTPAAGVTPTLNIQAETRVGDYEVYLRLTGPPDTIETSLSSNPPLGERDLQSLLLTGRTTGVSGDVAGGDSFAMGAVSADILGFAGSFVGFDTISFGQTTDLDLVAADVDPATRFTVTRRLGDQFELILSQNLDENELTWVIVYKPGRKYQIRVSSRDNQEETLEFRHEIEFGPGGSSRVPASAGRRSEAIIAAVDLTGEGDVDVRELRSLLALDPGDRFDFAKWQRDHARLERFYRERGYLAVRVVPRRRIVDETPGHERVVLEFRIEQGPRTVIETVGYELPARLRQAVGDARADSVFASVFAEDAAELVRRHLVDRGFLRAEVTGTVTQQGDALERVVLEVTPGLQTARRHVVFTGHEVVDTATLDAIAASQEHVQAAWWDPEPLLAAIRRLYATRGFLSAEASAGAITVDGDVATLPVAIIEGPRAQVSDIAFGHLRSMPVEEAAKTTGLALGGVYTLGDERAAAVRLRSRLRNLGYADARVVPRVRMSDDKTAVALRFDVDEGVQQIVRSVRLEGVDAASPERTRRAISIQPDQPARPSDALQTQRALYQQGIFRKAEITFEPILQDDIEGPPHQVPVDAVVSVEEFRKYSLRYGISVSNQTTPGFEELDFAPGVAADLRDRNFLGRGWSAGVGGRYDLDLWSVRTLFTVPRFAGLPVITNLYVTVREEVDVLSGIDVVDDETDLQLEQRWRPFGGAELTWGYLANWRDVAFDAVSGDQRTELLRISGRLASLNLTGVIDRRDSPFDATRGWLHSSSVQWGLQPLGSDFTYLRYLVRQFGYQPVGPFVLAGGVRWGSIWALDGIPPLTAVDLLFTAGGSQTVRGYADESLSAAEILGVPVGGPTLLILNSEIRFPIFKWFKGVLFADAGNTFLRRGDVSFDDLAVGAGFGLRINTPLAPIRLDLAYPLDRRPGDKRYRIHFSIGQMF